VISDHGVRGFKFHPSLQAFSPDDRSYYPLWSSTGSAPDDPSGGPPAPETIMPGNS
jgi:hypothetical protein